jgi:hypothetical protein
MPHKKKPRRFITPLVLFTLAGWALWALGRNEPEASKASEAGSSTGPQETDTRAPAARQRATWSKRRLATSLAFATLFFGGAAFSAGAGDVVAEAIEGGDTTTEVTSTEEAPSEEPAPAEEEPGAENEQPSEEGEPPAEESEPPAEESEPPAEESEPPAEGEQPGDSGEEPSEEGETPGDNGEEPGDGETPPPLPGDDGDQGEDPGDGETPPPPPLPGEDGDDGDGGTPSEPEPDPGVGDRPGSQPANPDLPVIDQKTRSGAALDPEVDADGFFATIWLHRPLPDPTPPAKRLRPAFATALAREARAAKVDWALVLGVLRARGFDSSAMSIAPVRSTARRLADLGARRNALRALSTYGGDEFAREAYALRNYNRGVGLRSLVDGFEASKGRLQRVVLRDDRLLIYPGGRLDIAMGRVDVRVLVLLRYLAEFHGQVTVSSLISGHRLYSRPGVISAHVYGLAVDIAALNHLSIYGNQERGGLTERAVRNILLLPSELQAKQVISLLGLGGPSFPLADHDDHIHVGY